MSAGDWLKVAGVLCAWALFYGLLFPGESGPLWAAYAHLMAVSLLTAGLATGLDWLSERYAIVRRNRP